MLSVIIPANNEEAHLGACLDALVGQDFAGPAEVVVAANACTDSTVALAEGYRAALAGKGWELTVLDLPEPGKLGALNRADAVAKGPLRAYLDADVICSPALLRELVAALDVETPRYASGTLEVAPAQSWATRRFARVWTRLPFMQTNVPGAGLFCVNGPGRARWGAFPDIISDDGYVRLMFTPEERVKVEASYVWPLVEGFPRLVRVRRRQDAGIRELGEKFPEILANESKRPLTRGDYLRLFAGQPVSFLVYVGVLLSVRFGPGQAATGWARGR